MKSNKREAARRKLLSILPRSSLEEMSHAERPHIKSRTELIDDAASKWDEKSVREAIDLIFDRADLPLSTPDGQKT